MNDESRDAMNNITVFEARIMHAECGYVTIIGNGTVTALVPENEAEEAEIARCEHGF